MDIVIQAPHLAPDDIDALVALTGAEGVEPLTRAGNDACRLHAVAADDGVAEACAAAGYDFARIADARSLSQVRLVAMDMDSTLITIECVDEIADAQGIKPQVAAITERAMRGEIDFAASLRSRVALLAGVPVSALGAIYDERLRLSPGAERMLAAFKSQGTRTLLVSGGFTFFTDRLRERLGLDGVIANTLDVVDGRLTGRLQGDIVDAAAKAREVRKWRAAAHADGGIVVALGDGANDLPMFADADVSIAYHAKPVVRARATHAIDHCGLDATLNLFD
ncbi:MAG: phosphoserine phosphatase SerB [Betaproteobacteria bacterium]